MFVHMPAEVLWLRIRCGLDPNFHTSPPTSTPDSDLAREQQQTGEIGDETGNVVLLLLFGAEATGGGGGGGGAN